MLPLKTILSILLVAATTSPCLALVPKQPKQATRHEVVERLANAALHPARPRRSNGPCPTLPTGTAPQSLEVQDPGDELWIYQQYYSGLWFTEDPNNPGNDNPDFPPYTKDIGYLDVPDAIQQCSQLSYEDTASYDSFDLHFLMSTCTWICVQYFDPNYESSYFDQANPDAAVVYGYYGGSA